MKEVLVILIVIAGLFAFTAFRYRRQIKTVWNIWRMLRHGAKRNGGPRQNTIQEKTGSPLVSCPRCGKWVFESRSIKLGAAAYCSRDCVERAIQIN